jgi:hypothetical protein
MQLDPPPALLPAAQALNSLISDGTSGVWVPSFLVCHDRAWPCKGVDVTGKPSNLGPQVGERLPL